MLLQSQSEPSSISLLQRITYMKKNSNKKFVKVVISDKEDKTPTTKSVNGKKMNC